MTIRQSLERRGQRTVAGTSAFLLGAGLLVSSGPRIFVLRFVFAVLMGAVVLAAVWSLFEIPCPNCRKRLGRIGFCVASGLLAKLIALLPALQDHVRSGNPKRAALGLDKPAAIHNHMVVDTLSTTFMALSDPTRRSILGRLAHGPASVSELAAPFAMSQQAISKHLAYLERARLIDKRRSGRQHFCILNPAPLAALPAG